MDDEILDELEEILITSDVGVDTTIKIIQRIEERVAKDKYISTAELDVLLREEIAGLLEETIPLILEASTYLLIKALCYYGCWCQWGRQNHHDW